VDGVDALLTLPEAPAVLGVDMVVGLPDQAAPGGRRCDRAARQLLGRPRSASVFSPPAYGALSAETYDEAVRRNRASGPDAPGLSKQTFHLFPKMRALAAHMTAARQDRVREVHPELAFYALRGGAPMAESKHTEAGRDARAALLAAHGFPNVDAGPGRPGGRRPAGRPRRLLDRPPHPRGQGRALPPLCRARPPQRPRPAHGNLAMRFDNEI
jgi:predicted RNase H-like nuclease